MTQITSTWSLLKTSWQILRKDKEMLIFPILSGLCCLSIIASFFMPVGGENIWRAADSLDSPYQSYYTYALMFLFFFFNYFVIIFFNSAMVACVVIRIKGNNPTVGDGFNLALKRLPYTFVWALIAATVGFLIRILEFRSKNGRAVARILEMAWAAVSFFVLPIIVVEKMNPFSAIKKSENLMKKTWGKNLIWDVKVGLLFFLFTLPAIPPLMLIGESNPSLKTAFYIGLFYTVIVYIILSALQAVLNTVIYVYALDHELPAEFSSDQINRAIHPI